MQEEGDEGQRGTPAGEGLQHAQVGESGVVCYPRVLAGLESCNGRTLVEADGGVRVMRDNLAAGLPQRSEQAEERQQRKESTADHPARCESSGEGGTITSSRSSLSSTSKSLQLA